MAAIMCMLSKKTDSAYMHHLICEEYYECKHMFTFHEKNQQDKGWSSTSFKSYLIAFCNEDGTRNHNLIWRVVVNKTYSNTTWRQTNKYYHDCVYVNYQWYLMMASNGNIFRVTGFLWREFTGHRWFPLTQASDAELWCFPWSAPEQTVEQTIEIWWFETPSRPLWRHRNALFVMMHVIALPLLPHAILYPPHTFTGSMVDWLMLLMVVVYSQWLVYQSWPSMNRIIMGCKMAVCVRKWGKWLTLLTQVNVLVMKMEQYTYILPCPCEHFNIKAIFPCVAPIINKKRFYIGNTCY